MTPDGTEGRAVLLLRDRVKPAQVYIHRYTTQRLLTNRDNVGLITAVLSCPVAGGRDARARARAHT